MEENRKEFVLDMNKMVNTIYNNIAEWHNEDGMTPDEKSMALKYLSHSIIETVISEAFRQLDGARVKSKIIFDTKNKKDGGLLSRFLRKK